MSEENFMVCGSSPAIMGSESRRCAECNARVYLAPSGQRTVSEQNLTVICVSCGERKMTHDPRREVMPIRAEQVAELLQAHLRGRSN